jgi:hypothetical protein
VLFAVAGAITLLDGLYLLTRRNRLLAGRDQPPVPHAEPELALSSGRAAP